MDDLQLIGGSCQEKKKALTRHSMMKQAHGIAENVLKDNKSAVADLWNKTSQILNNHISTNAYFLVLCIHLQKQITFRSKKSYNVTSTIMKEFLGSPK